MAAGEIEAGYWVPLNEYLALKKVSVSTARRRIRSGAVRAELRKGKYYIYVLWEGPQKGPLDQAGKDDGTGVDQSMLLHQQIHSLQQQVQDLKQENSDLRMLIKAYETKLEQPKDARI